MLKRSREEAGLAGRVWELIQISEALPTAHAGHSPPAAAAPQQQPARVTVEHAQRYIFSVRERFAARREVYDTFMATLQEFRQGNLDEAGVAHRMRLLLAGHPDLLAGFGCFLSRDSGPVLLGPPSPENVPAAAGLPRVRMA